MEKNDKRIMRAFLRLFLLILLALISTSATRANAEDVWSMDDTFYTSDAFSLVTRNGSNQNSVIFSTPVLTYNGKMYTCYRDHSLDTYAAMSVDNGKTWTHSLLQAGNTNDAHNACSVGVDKSGYLHFSYDHHNVALKYKVSTAPESITSFVKGTMLGTNETKVTYPRFFTTPTGELFFSFRDGGSGNGNTFIRKFDNTTRTWSNFSGPLIDGKATNVSAYESGMMFDTEGDIHLFWVWRVEANPTTNKNLLYAKYDESDARWEKINGDPYTLPIKEPDAEIVLNIPMKSGLANTNAAAVDSMDRPHTAILKNAADGKTEVHHVYHNGTEWVTTVVTNMDRTSAGAWDLGRPQIIIKPDNTIYIFFTDSHQSTNANFTMPPGDLYWVKSTDMGATWTEPVKARAPKSAEFVPDYELLKSTGDFRFFFQDVTSDVAPLYILDGEKLVRSEEDIAEYDNINPSKALLGTIELQGLGTQCTELRPEIAGFWQFEETTGSVLDTGANNIAGTIYGNVNRETNGVVGNAFVFSGAGSVKFPDRSELDFGTTKDFTVQAWIKTDVSQTGRTLVSKYTSGRAPGYFLQILNNHFRASIRDGSGTGVQEMINVEGSTDITDGEWHHVAAVYDRGGTLSIYVDGVLDADPVSIASVTGSVSNASGLVIGGRSVDSEFFIGEIDQVVISNGALSPEDFNYEDSYEVNCSTATGTYTSPFHVWDTENREYESITVTAALNGGSITAEVQVSDDKFATVDESYTLDVMNGINTYSLPIQSSGRYSRVIFNLTSPGGSTPSINSFSVVSQDL